MIDCEPCVQSDLTTITVLAEDGSETNFNWLKSVLRDLTEDSVELKCRQGTTRWMPLRLGCRPCSGTPQTSSATFSLPADKAMCVRSRKEQGLGRQTCRSLHYVRDLIEDSVEFKKRQGITRVEVGLLRTRLARPFAFFKRNFSFCYE